MIGPPDSGFAQFLAWKKLQKDRITYHIGCFNLDMTNYCRCDPSIKNLRVFYNHDENFDMLEPQHAFSREGKLWDDPQWNVLPNKFREVLFICAICVYGPILLAGGGVNMRLRCIKKKIVRHSRVLGNLTTYVRKTHLPTFTMNEGNHR